MATDPAQAAKDPGVAFYLELDRHKPDEKRGGCTCGFCPYSADHVAIMAWRAVTPLIRAQAFTEAANAVEIRVAISDPGRYTPRKRAGYQPDESLAQWQARAVGIVIRGLSEGTENA